MDAIPTSEQSEQVARMLRDAHLHRMRKQWAHAETLCRRALELAPDDAIGQEMLGDLLAEKGESEEALKLYRQSLERQAGKASLEEKIARLVLQQGEEERARLEAKLLLENPRRDAARKRNSRIVVLLSALLPGAGQLFLGEHVKGGILLAVGLFCFYFGVPELVKFMMSFGAVPRSAGGSGVVISPPNGLLSVLGIVGVAIYIYSLLDASSRAGKTGSGLGG